MYIPMLGVTAGGGGGGARAPVPPPAPIPPCLYAAPAIPIFF